MYYNPIFNSIAGKPLHDEDGDEYEYYAGALDVSSGKLVNMFKFLAPIAYPRRFAKFKLKKLTPTKETTFISIYDVRESVSNNDLTPEIITENIYKNKYIIGMSKNSDVPIKNKKYRNKKSIFRQSSIPVAIKFTVPINNIMYQMEDNTSERVSDKILISDDTVFGYKLLDRYVFSIPTNIIKIQSMYYISPDKKLILLKPKKSLKEYISTDYKSIEFTDFDVIQSELLKDATEFDI